MKLSEFSCPVCRQVAEPANQIHVCANCHSDLVTRGQVSLTSTAEFKAMSLNEAASILGKADPAPPTTTPAPTPATAATCNWCGSGEAQVKKLLSNRGVHICNGCVALCADILAAELGDDWR